MTSLAWVDLVRYNGINFAWLLKLKVQILRLSLKKLFKVMRGFGFCFGFYQTGAASLISWINDLIDTKLTLDVFYHGFKST